VDCKGFDEQVVRLDSEIAAIANDFVLARITNMRGVNLNVLTFDYDLTWATLVIDADQRVYARYGSREDTRAEGQLSLAGLKHTLRKALAAYRSGAKPPLPPNEPPRTVEQYPAAERLKSDACIHCHQVYDFRRDQLRTEGKWSRDDIWVHPPPKNIGLTLDVDQGDRVTAVAAGSPADRAGLKPGDVLQRLNGQPVSSFADVRHALHLAPKVGTARVVWQRDGKEQSGMLELRDGWRESDIFWRESMWGLAPSACVYGENLPQEERHKLGLSDKRLAFRQGQFVPPVARRAGIQAGDIILGLDGREMEMTMLQFNAHIRLNYKVGDTVTYELIRNGQRLKVSLTLPERSN
jgi:serine protease Do